jgi:hypothetical protein
MCYAALMKFLMVFNDYTGVILVVIALGIWKIAPTLTAILRHIECLHEDFDIVHDAHERIAHAQQVRMDADLSREMQKG